jgi:aminopeptidase YwaD
MKNSKILNCAIILGLLLVISPPRLGQQSQRPPSVDRLRAHVTFLASDKLEGRRTGTKGANEAADYIATQFVRIGLIPFTRTQPKYSLRDYQQTFPYVAGLALGKNNVLTSATYDSASAKLGEEWTPLGMSTSGRVSAPAVFAGYGLNVSELNHNDYAGIDATGKIVVVVAGTPDGDNPHGQFARYEGVRWKAVAARNAGAKALVVVAKEEKLQDDSLSRLTYDNSAGDAGIPVILISRQLVGRLVPAANASELEATARAKTSSQRNSSPITVSITTDVVRQTVQAANVIGILEGSDPVLKNEAIIIGGHYDHLGLGGSGSLAPREGEIHHGADDNASGTAGVLELARLFADERPRPRRTIVFIAFSGEEEGLLGSNFYVNHPTAPLANTIAMINMDMIGRMKNQNLIIGGVGTATEWRSMLESANAMQAMTVTANAGMGDSSSMPMVVSSNGRTIVSSDPSKQFVLTLNEDGFGPSDHSSFYIKQIPVLFFWTGTHDDYHKPSDTADKINYEDEARILSLAARVITDVDKADKRPTYTLAKVANTGRSTGFRVYLGTIPNYSDSNDGLLLDGVRDDSPAAKAGLKAGDRIVKLAGKDIRNVYDYTYALGEMKAGQEYDVEIVRGSERLTLKLTPAARK